MEQCLLEGKPKKSGFLSSFQNRKKAQHMLHRADMKSNILHDLKLISLSTLFPGLVAIMPTPYLLILGL